jgi:Ribbon-helix-helix protein, copG family
MITITLDDATAAILRRLAALEQRSESEIVHTALAAYADGSRPRPTGIGKYRSGRSDISAKARGLQRFEELEDQADPKAAKKALKEKGRVPLEAIKRRLRMT